MKSICILYYNFIQIHDCALSEILSYSDLSNIGKIMTINGHYDAWKVMQNIFASNYPLYHNLCRLFHQYVYQLKNTPFFPVTYTYSILQWFLFVFVTFTVKDLNSVKVQLVLSSTVVFLKTVGGNLVDVKWIEILICIVNFH